MRFMMLLLVAVASCTVCAQTGWREDTSAAPWDERSEHCVETFQGKLWIMGGASVGGTQANVWSSIDGGAWNEEVPWLPWSDWFGADTVVFNNKMWVIGGFQSGLYQNYVWSSADGVNWVKEVAAAPWVGRAWHQCAVFDNRMWVIGGRTKQTPYLVDLNDVWSSPDGINWTQEVAAAAWSARIGHSVVVHNGRMWVVGGGGGSGTLRDVWSSSDGANWVQENPAAPWSTRYEHTTVVFRDRIWVMGGKSAFFYNDVWSSPDGITWTQLADAPWTPRFWHESVVHNGRIWVLGGLDDIDGDLNDVWSYGLYMTPGSLPLGEVDRPYAAALQAHEGDGPFLWTLTSGSLPGGLVLGTPTGNTLPITGTPKESGKFQFTMLLEDKDGFTVEQTITLKIVAPLDRNSAKDAAGEGCTAGPLNPQIPAAIVFGIAATAAITRRRRTAVTRRGEASEGREDMAV